MTTLAVRTTLPQRRSHEAFNFTHWDQRYAVGIGRAADGSLKEIFINGGKTGMQMDTLARDSAVLLSIALQYGVPIEPMRHAITRNSDGTACGPIGALLDLLGDGARGAK
jgi:hypothetical protein